jgi:outer membrane protein assembly factor BamB
MTDHAAEKRGHAPGLRFYLPLGFALLAVTVLLLVYSFREYYTGTGARVEDFPAMPQETDTAAARAGVEGAYRGGPARTAFFPNWQGGDKAPAEDWRTDNMNTEGVFTSPVVADGSLFMVTGLDRFDFERFMHDESVPVGFFDERISTYGGAAVALEAVDTETRQVRWVYLLSEDWGIAPSGPVPMVDGGTVYTGTGDNGCVLAIETTTVAEKWRFCAQPGDPATQGYFPIRAALAVSDGLVLAGAGDGNLYALDAASGAERWRFHAQAPVLVAPAVYGGIVYFGTSDDGGDPNLYAVDLASGREVWRFPTGGPVAATAAVADGIVYFQSTDRNLYALDAADGQLLWRFDTGHAGYNSPAVAKGRVFTNRISDENGHAWIDALDARDGSIQWEADLKRNYTGDPIVAGGSLLVESEGRLISLDVRNGREQWQQGGGGQGTSPTIADGVLYVGGQWVRALRPRT